MERKLGSSFTKAELELLRVCKFYRLVFPGTSERVTPQRREPGIRFLANEFNNAMKEARVQNEEKYPHYVENFEYKKNPLFTSLKKCVESHIRSAAQPRMKKTGPLSKGTASSGKGATGGAAKANPPMEGAAAAAAASGIASDSQPLLDDDDAVGEGGAHMKRQPKRRGKKFSKADVRADVLPLIEGIDEYRKEEQEKFNRFLNENFGNPYGCSKLNTKAVRVFLINELLKRMYENGMMVNVHMFPDEEGVIKYFLRPGRNWEVHKHEMEKYNDAFRALQNLYFGRYEGSKGVEKKGTSSCMDMLRALGFVIPREAKAHGARKFRGPIDTDPTKMKDANGDPIHSTRDCLYHRKYEYNPRNVRNNLNHLWKDAAHQVRKSVQPNKRNLRVLLEAAQAVDSASSSERASEPNPLGYSTKRACFGPK